jgi:hypothetical protein
MQDFKVFSLDTIEKSNIKFKISANNYDGSVIIFAKNDISGHAFFKCFSSSKQGREWVDELVSAAKIIHK